MTTRLPPLPDQIERLRRLVDSLPRKIAASYVAVVVVSLLLSALAFAGVLQGYRDEQRVNDMTNVAAGLAALIVEREQLMQDLPELTQRMSQLSALGKRILLTDQNGYVKFDTGDALGREIPVIQLRPPRPVLQFRGSTVGYAGDYRSPAGTSYLYVSLVAPRDVFNRPTQDYAVVIVEPKPSLLDGLDKIAPALATAGLIALLVTLPVAAFLAKSIARPVRQMTRASAEMARGNYDQQIPVTSHDELGRLAATFNTMAHEVSRTNRMLRDLIGNVSHELKTPLTSIQGFSQALLDGAAGDPDEQRRAVGIIHEEANRMRRLVDDLLYISKLESGQIKIAREPIELSVLLEQCLRRSEWQADVKAVRLDLRVEGRPHTLGDGYRLEQVFGNLLENAVRHTPPGGAVTITASEAGSRANGSRGTGEVQVSVHNTGSYIPPPEAARVFERFYQVDRSRAQSGAGLGLSIVQELLAAHGGAVAVTSDPDTGTSFLVTLPAHVPAALPEPVAAGADD